ncbi:hypothetical protein KL930_001833 [Ogataea haglerorum]|uniref:Uncharacterized protein n=1 Tax=Ogataea haglerorum TaxID=1937702 RepID=A0AAN6D9Z5_9ASCO|nr:uncharacterized protein KL911_001774 [Ogataea haglerorum]KAG7698171.1 hypothetical protein KL915_001888 [Ogataea haglerorum]KAG7699535.1 hypothetical protein KL951_001252 [Ogataea haglerorum]KAG7710580.1 hypothetical protein KL950_001493 [Ogataea haglerorum]KAG7730037.1 hypothetical protein KL933_001117 [Ogataea haglerorum]KAG7732536.1 hypothetical protein KL948_001966 [Ogataea haglerorum]
MVDPTKDDSSAGTRDIRQLPRRIGSPYDSARPHTSAQENVSRPSTLLPPLTSTTSSTSASSHFYYQSPQHFFQRNTPPYSSSYSDLPHSKGYNYLPQAPPRRLSSSRTSIFQTQISPVEYAPADPGVDLSIFTEEDAVILRNLLPLAEIHKWKFVATKLSKRRSKKLNADFCIKKFHEMFDLPFNPAHSLFNSQYFLRASVGTAHSKRNLEGLVGSSLPYIVCKDGWNNVHYDTSHRASA